MKTINFIILIFSLCITFSIHAQLTVDAELRPRFEYRHGFKTLFPDNTNPAAFVSQRTRLNTGYSTEKLNFHLSLQDVRVWGDVPQLNIADNNGLSLHQAWGEISFNKTLSLKLGRQEIFYDDHRILGNVGWAQQARSHEAVILKFANDKIRLDLGFAFNQDAEKVVGNYLTISNTYKSMQYAWLHKNWKNFEASFLLLNNGLQFIDETNSYNNETRFSHTLGSHFNYSFEKMTLISNLYYQFGKDIGSNRLNGFLLALEANYNASETWKLTIGSELLSGNEYGTITNGDNNAFTPLYGTNHKFNGLMDYFYVGNHGNNVGLWDNYIKAKLLINKKSSLAMAFHNFLSPSEIAPSVSKQLGLETDLVYSYNLDENIAISAGYSHLSASEGLEIIKNNYDDNTNNWGWAMITIKPILFKNMLQ